MVRVALVSLSLALVACGSLLSTQSNGTSSTEKLSADCIATASEYANALADALICTPGIDSCAAQLPAVVYEQTRTQQQVLKGICNCTVALNPARTATAETLLTKFKSQGCNIFNCPCAAGLDTAAHACRPTVNGAGTCD